MHWSGNIQLASYSVLTPTCFGSNPTTIRENNYTGNKHKCTITAERYIRVYLVHKRFNGINQTLWLCIHITVRLRQSLLGTFAELLKATVSFFTSFCPSAWTTRLLMDGFWLNLIFEYFSKTCRKKSKFHYNIKRLTGTLHKDQRTFL